MVYLVNQSRTPRDANEILSDARNALPPKVILRDVRVADSFIELDCSVPEELDFEDILVTLARLSPVQEVELISERQMDDQSVMIRAIEMFNAQKYWSAHEALEPLWRRSSGNEKDLLNGMILVAAAMVHNQKDETEICLSILSRAEAKLGRASGKFHGIDVDRVKLKISEILASGQVEKISI